MKKYPLLALIPFVSFLIGYFCMTFFYSPELIKTPLLLGTTIHEAVLTTSALGITIKIIDQKELANILPGTILRQHPAAYSAMKTGQSIYCVISKDIPKKRAISLLGLTEQEVEAQVKNQAVYIKKFSVANARYKHGVCFAQYPKENAPLKKNYTLYFAQNLEPLVIFPQLTGLLLDDVLLFLQSYGITPTLIPSGHSTSKINIINQTPLPGTIISLQPEKIPTVQLQVS